MRREGAVSRPGLAACCLCLVLGAFEEAGVLCMSPSGPHQREPCSRAAFGGTDTEAKGHPWLSPPQHTPHPGLPGPAHTHLAVEVAPGPCWPCSLGNAGGRRPGPHCSVLCVSGPVAWLGLGLPLYTQPSLLTPLERVS